MHRNMLLWKLKIHVISKKSSSNFHTVGFLQCLNHHYRKNFFINIKNTLIFYSLRAINLADIHRHSNSVRTKLFMSIEFEGKQHGKYQTKRRLLYKYSKHWKKIFALKIKVSTRRSDLLVRVDFLTKLDK